VRYGEEASAHGRKRRVVEYNPFEEHQSIVPPAFLEAVERREGHDLPAAPVEPAVPEVEDVDREEEAEVLAPAAGTISQSRGDEAGPSAPLEGLGGEGLPTRVDVLPVHAAVVPRVEVQGGSSSTSGSGDEGGPAFVEVDVDELFGLN
jgi:hypothetical protein